MSEDVQEPPQDVVLSVTSEKIAAQAIPEKVVQEANSMVPVQAGFIMPQNQQQLSWLIGILGDGSAFPAGFDTKPKRLAAYSLGFALMGQQWHLAVNNMAFIKGKLSIWGELPGTLAERTGEVAEKNVYAINKDYKKICTENKNIDDEPYAGVCEIQRKGRVKKEFTYTIKEAEKAGQYPATRRDGSPNADSPWMKFTKVMLMRKSMALGVKFEFPEALVGVPIAEYDYDEAPDLVKDVTPRKTASELNSKFSAQAAIEQ